VTRVKICGLTRAEDVELCGDLGAAYLGFNFSARSPRRIDPGRAPDLLAAAEGCRRVGVFVDEGRDEVRRAIDAMRLDFLQFHREVRDGDFEFGLPVIAVERVFGGVVSVSRPLFARCHAVLFDTGHAELAGGTGDVFDWGALSGGSGPPFGVAGGLRAENVGDAIRAVRPLFVDVATGVESSPGVKDPAKLRAFFEAVRRADG